MASRDVTTDAPRAGVGTPGVFRSFARRLSTETKQAFKTTEFWAFVIVGLMLLIAANSVEGNEGGTDYFAADTLWLYITALTIGYMLSRGLAKSGVRDPYNQAGTNEDGGDGSARR